MSCSITLITLILNYSSAYIMKSYINIHKPLRTNSINNNIISNINTQIISNINTEISNKYIIFEPFQSYLSDLNINIIYDFICIILLIYLIVYTPKYLSNMLMGKLFGTVVCSYITSDSKLISYEFNHKDFDGYLMAHHIKNSLVEPTTIKSIDSTNLTKYDFNNYQYIKCDRIKTYTLFTSTIATIIKKIFNNQNKDKINVAILVSIRHLLDNKYEKGNYLKWAIYTVNKYHTIEEICKIHHNAVNKTKTNHYWVPTVTIKDFLELKNIDYVFDAWRSLTYIERTDNIKLVRVNRSPNLDNTNTKEICISREDIQIFYIKSNKAAVFLDFFNNSYIFSGISVF